MTGQIDSHSNYPWKNAALGAAVETTIRQPLMALTSNMINQKFGILESAKSLWKRGGPIAFYSGIDGILIGFSQRILHRVSTFGMNHEFKERGYGFSAVVLSAAALETSLTMTGEMFLTASQTNQSSKSPLKIFQDRLRSQGMRTLVTGLHATVGRNISFNMGYFGSSFFFGDKTIEYPLSSAFLSACSAVGVSHFFEILRVEKVSSPGMSYSAIVRRLRSTLGYRWLTVGFLPRLSSVGLGSFIAMGVYNKITFK